MVTPKQETLTDNATYNNNNKRSYKLFEMYFEILFLCKNWRIEEKLDMHNEI